MSGLSRANLLLCVAVIALSCAAAWDGDARCGCAQCAFGYTGRLCAECRPGYADPKSSGCVAQYASLPAIAKASINFASSTNLQFVVDIPDTSAALQYTALTSANPSDLVNDKSAQDSIYGEVWPCETKEAGRGVWKKGGGTVSFTCQFPVSKDMKSGFAVMVTAGNPDKTTGVNTKYYLLSGCITKGTDTTLTGKHTVGEGAIVDVMNPVDTDSPSAPSALTVSLSVVGVLAVVGVAIAAVVMMRRRSERLRESGAHVQLHETRE